MSLAPSEPCPDTCLTLLQAHNYAYVIPIIRWGESIQQELSEGWSRIIQHDLTGELDRHSWTVEFPVYIDCTYLDGRYDEHCVARHGSAADAPFIGTPRDARYHYSKRFGIERAIACLSKRQRRQRHETRRSDCYTL